MAGRADSPPLSPTGPCMCRESCWQHPWFGLSNSHCSRGELEPSNLAKRTVPAEIFHACSPHYAGIFRSFSKSNLDICKNEVREKSGSSAKAEHFSSFD